MGLKDYQAKRDFKQTPEPKGKSRPSKTSAIALRFVVQKHRASRLHYDFRLELDGVLKSWAVPKGPSLNPADKRLAMLVEDHPLDYGEFEGVIPAGNYGAGEVIVWDEGTYEPYLKDEGVKSLHSGLASGDLKFILHGKKLNGAYALVKIKRAEENAWLLIKKADEYVSDQDVTQQQESVKSGRRVEELAESDPAPKAQPGNKTKPRFIKPMLASLSAELVDQTGWSYEIKWDGYRIMAVVEPPAVKLWSRNQQDYTAKFQPIADELAKLKKPLVLDGEVVVLDEQGRARFQLLQNYQTTGEGQLVYYVFDLLHLDGYDTLSLTLAERRELLAKLISGRGRVRLSQAVTQGQKLLQAAKQQQLEGIIGKANDSRYVAGTRSRQWLKFKTKLRQEAVIGGYTEPRGSRQLIGALILGVYRGGQLVYIGHAGGGFSEQVLAQLHQRLLAQERKTSPFASTPKTNTPVHWVTPKLVCEVEFAEWTTDGHMRQPIFLGLRADKSPTAVVKEQADQQVVGRLELKHLDKIYWPKEGYTKGDLLNYYRAVAPTMLPYLADRPHSLNRHPDGIEGGSFYQKDMTDKAPDWLKTFRVHSESEDRDINYLVGSDETSLLYMANLGCIEINPWLSRTKKPDHPDYCVIDLDPEDIGFAKVIQVALKVHEILDGLKVPHWCKTSGATGLHIYIPLAAKYTYEQSKQFAQLIAQLTHQALPRITSLERSPAKRQQRVYVDYLQNRRGQTLAAPYSVRPRPGAPVSTPLEWREVKPGLSPKQFTMFNTPERLSQVGDLWAPLAKTTLDLRAALAKLET